MKQRRINLDDNGFLLGFDNVFNHMFNKQQHPVSYPPHNIYKLSKDDPYSDMVIEIAIAGIRKEDIDITLTDQDVLKVSYDGTETTTNDYEYIHKGIATRKFVLEWRMNKDLEVEEASCNDGVLRIKIANHSGSNKHTQRIAIN
jgi:HSP20 family molecular chaperone IbpA